MLISMNKMNAGRTFPTSSGSSSNISASTVMTTTLIQSHQSGGSISCRASETAFRPRFGRHPAGHRWDLHTTRATEHGLASNLPLTSSRLVLTKNCKSRLDRNAALPASTCSHAVFRSKPRNTHLQAAARISAPMTWSKVGPPRSTTTYLRTVTHNAGS